MANTFLQLFGMIVTKDPCRGSFESCKDRGLETGELRERKTVRKNAIIARHKQEH